MKKWYYGDNRRVSRCMKKYVVVFILMFCIFPFNYVWAECTDEEISDLKDLADMVQIDVEFDYDAIEYGFFDRNIVTVQNLPNDLYIRSSDNAIGIFSIEAVDGIITEKVDSSTTELRVYSNMCENIILRKIKLDAKAYNLYSDSELCEGIDGDDLDVCDEFYDDYISQEEFEKKVNDYKNKKNSVSEKVKNSLSDYYLYILGGVILLILIIILLIIRNRKRSKLD